MSNYRMLRIGLLVAVVVGGILFHHQGRGYDVMRGVYFVIIIGFLLWRLVMRASGRAPGRRNRNQTPGPYGSSSPTEFGGPQSFGGPPDHGLPPQPPTSPPPTSQPPPPTAS
jgi:hypothetical protein